MEYRRFGKTGLQVSVFTLGGMRFHKVMAWPYHHLPDDSLDSTLRVIKTAFDAGINLIETARNYGKSERLIGEALQRLPHPRASYHIMTKAPAVIHASEMRRWIEQSLERLQVDKLDLFAFHGINTVEACAAVMAKGGSFEGVEQARKEGLIGSVGFSTHAQPPVLREILNTRAFDFVNLHYYFFRQANQESVERAGALDMGVLIISPNDQGGRLYDPPPLLTQGTHPLHPAVFNERWLLGHRQIHTLSIGLDAPTQMALHQKSLVVPSSSGTEEIQQIAHRLEKSVRTSPLHRCGICTRCHPCPEGINMPEMFRLLKLSHVFGMRAYGQFRYRNMWRGDAWAPGAVGSVCTQCGDCLPRCPEGLAIPALLALTHEMVNSGGKRWQRIRSKTLEIARSVLFLRRMEAWLITHVLRR